MSVHRPKEWIAAVLAKFDKLLALSVTKNVPLSSQLESHKDCLMNISESKCPTVISGLTSSLKKLSNIRIYGDLQEYNLYTCQIVVLNLLEKCITAKDSALPEDSILMKQLLPEICQFLHQQSNEVILTQLRTSAIQVLYCISQNNFNIVFNRIATRLNDLSKNPDDVYDLCDLDLIKHVHIDVSRLTRLIEEIVLKFRSLKKNVQVAVLSNLHIAVWRWVCSYPTELNLLYKPDQGSENQNDPVASSDVTQVQIQISYEELISRNRLLSNAAEKLFDLIDAAHDGSKKKASLCWPLQALLLVLCPDIINQNMTPQQLQKTSKTDIFMNMKKLLSSSSNRQVQENCVDAFICVMKVGTCVAPNRSDEKCCIHKLVDSFLPDLLTFLFENGSKYFLKTSDQDSLIECFVSSFRLDPDQDALPRQCASSSSSVNHKMVLVQAMYCISVQPSLPWWPKIDVLYCYGSDIRKIFCDCVMKLQAQVHTSPRSTQSLREKMERMNVGLKRSSQDDSLTYRDLLRVILQLVQGNPTVFLHNLGTTSQQIHSEVFDFFSHLLTLFSVRSNSNLQLSMESLGALLHLHDPRNILLWNPESPMTTFWEISSYVMSSVCDKLLTNQMVTSREVTLQSVKWLQQVLGCRIEFLLHNHHRAGAVNSTDTVKKTKFKLEMTLLEHLWHSDDEVVAVVLSCFQGLYEETELRWSFDDYMGGRLGTERHEAYRELSAASLLAEDEVIQEKVRAVFRRLAKFPPACLEAWEDTLTKWEAKTHTLTYRQIKDDFVTASGESPSSAKSAKKAVATKQDIQDWTNLSGFLCSLGGVCAKSVEAVSSSLSSLAWDRRTSSSSVASSSATPSTPAADNNARAGPGGPGAGKNLLSAGHASRFVGHLINFLANGNARIFDVMHDVRYLLATDLHPALYPTLFQQINLFLKTNLFNPAGRIESSPGADQFVDSVIFVLHNIFQTCSERDGDYLGEESIETVVLYIVRYIRQMGMRNPALGLRIMFCKMISEMMNRKSDFFFLSEIKFRNKLVEHLADWVMASSNQVLDVDNDLLRTLDVSAVVAIGALLNGLPLHPDEGDGGDVPKAKSQLFFTYFTLFMRLLGECADECDDTDVMADDVTIADPPSLRRSLVVAMSNLLSANIEYGLVHAMGLAYHPDIQTRAAFLEVLIKILQQGTAGFDTLGDSVSAERFERLVELVTMMGDNGELPIANALANVVHTSYMDELARVFVTLFDAKHLLYQLLWNMFTKEVEEADSVQTLFRGNSLASKIMRFCFKVYGASYLHNLVEPLVAWSLTPEISALQFDVDQKRIPPGVDIHQCRNNLQRLTERFFSRIMTSTDKFPPQLKSVCHCLYQVVSQRFHESGTGAVASAIFLRFLNPAIATPYECGLSEKPIPPNLAHAFKFMCKLMQNIANHVLFTKEEHMKHFNEFVRARFDVCQHFFRQISTPECSSVDSVGHCTSFMNDTNVQALHRLLWNDQEKIGQYLAKSRNAKAVGRRPFDKMVTLLAYLGPPEYTRPVLETRTTGQSITPCKFEELMTKRKVADSEEYKMVKGLNIFYQFGRSKMGYPVFYYIAKRYVMSEIREDILMFYILQALKPYSARKFDVIIDLTHVESKNGFRGQYLPKWLAVYTPAIYKNLNAIYVYNPNTWVRDYIKYNEETFAKVKNRQRIRFLENLAELQRYVELDHQKIPSATKSLDEDIRVYHNVYRSGHTKVDIKVGSRAVQFTTVEKYKLLEGEIVLNDIYYANEIESIQSMDESSAFGLKVASNNAVMLFSHPDARKIANGLRHIRARWELTQPKQDISTHHHKIGAKDVPGTLLNMALLNLGSPEPTVRLSAYNLLCVLTTSFNLQLGGRLCESEGLCIPANNTLFIVTISTTLAKNESHLTLEFLDECITGFRCLSDTLKNLCLEYMEPWLFNLPAFVCSTEIKRNKVKSVIQKLIELTIAEKEFYPSVQIKVWGNLGKMSGLTDLILESFVETSSQGGLGSLKAEVMADTAVSLAVNNMKIVSSKLINLLCTIVDKTSLRPTPTLEKHKHWDEIAILARFLLMLSFNNNLDVATHLPNLFHLVSLLLSTGPLSLRASIHGLVINIIHSLLTCNQPEFKEETRQILRLSLTEFCLPKFYQFFGISNVKSAADTAFQSEPVKKGETSLSLVPKRGSAASVNGCRENDDVINLSFLDVVSDALLEVMEACMKDVADCDWLSEWRDLSQKFAFQYNPSLQPRALVVFGCINKQPSLRHIKKILTIMGKSLESQADPILLEASLLALTRLQLLSGASPELKSTFFWVALSAMQMNEERLYAAGLSLLEQNMHHIDELGLLTSQPLSKVFMKSRSSFEQYFQPLDVAVGLSFASNFHFAFATHLLKGFRHSDSIVIARLIRILDFTLELISRHRSSHKYEVNPESAPYITALLPVCDEARRHCVPRKKAESSTVNSTTSSKLSNGHRGAVATPNGQEEGENCSDSPSSGSHSSRSRHNSIPEGSVATSSGQRVYVTADVRPQKSRKSSTTKMNKRPDSRECGTTPPKVRKVGEPSLDSDSSASSASHVTSSSMRSSRRKHSAESTTNALFGEDLLDQKAQALLITMLATQVKHSAKNSDVHVLFEYLAEASIIFPTVFPIVHSLLDHKINNILNQCEDTVILTHVQTIVHNAASVRGDDVLHKQITLLQDIGFGGIWRFAGPFAQVACLENASVVVNLFDNLVNLHLSDVPDLTPVASRQSLNSALSAASMDDIRESDESFENEDGDVIMSESGPDGERSLGVTPKPGSFRNKGPKLTIKLPS
uniref:Neurofibromin n=1 Tax=Phallusia mammillata TaxID=59560 RepID=A0A6F9DMV3_9ASCI|nr:neurofibromin [Phallusia mammillata]